MLNLQTLQKFRFTIVKVMLILRTKKKCWLNANFTTGLTPMSSFIHLFATQLIIIPFKNLIFNQNSLFHLDIHNKVIFRRHSKLFSLFKTHELFCLNRNEN